MIIYRSNIAKSTAENLQAIPHDDIVLTIGGVAANRLPAEFTVVGFLIRRVEIEIGDSNLCGVGGNGVHHQCADTATTLIGCHDDITDPKCLVRVVWEFVSRNADASGEFRTVECDQCQRCRMDLQPTLDNSLKRYRVAPI